jgi:phosphoribosylamine--glycine ligase
VRTACIVGGGAREHALAHVLGRTADVIATPGNPGIEGETPSGHTLRSTSVPPGEINADLFVIGPEAPLVDGLADRLRRTGRLVFGPGADGARLEGSKQYMKRLATEAGVPTARWGSFDELGPAVEFLRSLPGRYVVKTDGLASGKGVLVTTDLAEAEADVAAKLSGSAFGEAGLRVVIEEGLEGEELSVFAICDGRRALAMAPAQDYKRVGTGDTGPNTGGMGAYSPVPLATPEVVDEAMRRIVDPSLGALRAAGVDYRGVLYAGLMVTAEGVRLIEFNVRFGDPETEVVLPRLDGDLFELLAAAAAGRLPDEAPRFSDEAAVCVIAAAAGYPAAPVAGASIAGLDDAASLRGVTVFHAGTRRDDASALRVGGGRVLCVSALGETLAAAREQAYRAVNLVSFDGMHYRTDIGASPAGARSASASGGESGSPGSPGARAGAGAGAGAAR